MDVSVKQSSWQRGEASIRAQRTGGGTGDLKRSFARRPSSHRFSLPSPLSLSPAAAHHGGAASLIAAHGTAASLVRCSAVSTLNELCLAKSARALHSPLNLKAYTAHCSACLFSQHAAPAPSPLHTSDVQTARAALTHSLSQLSSPFLYARPSPTLPLLSPSLPSAGSAAGGHRWSVQVRPPLPLVRPARPPCPLRLHLRHRKRRRGRPPPRTPTPLPLHRRARPHAAPGPCQVTEASHPCTEPCRAVGG